MLISEILLESMILEGQATSISLLLREKKYNYKYSPVKT